jgi:predicted transcriptional regulator
MDNLFDRPIISSLFSVLRDEKRRKILNLIGRTGMAKITADYLVNALKISRPAVEKHLKQMLEIKLIDRSAETIPNLHYIYYIPEYSQDLVSDLNDCLETFINTLKEEYSARLEKEEQLYLVGRSSKEKYETLKEEYDKILQKIQKTKPNESDSSE